MRYAVDPDITIASTIDPAFYRDAEAYAAARQKIFARTWQWIGGIADVAEPSSLSPRTMLPGLIDEPLLLSRDREGTLRCLSNVCTHRGNLLVDKPCRAEQIRCRYHSRRFDLAGRMTFMPEFRDAKNFPSATDDLPAVPFTTWGGQAFASIDPIAPLDAFVADIARRVDLLPVAQFAHDPSRDRDFTIDAHWALYVENYLEGFHIPFVHAALNDVVEFASYQDELFRYATLSVARAKPGVEAFEASATMTDDGAPIAALYAWVFPNLMLNFYPWGLSLNCVLPLAVDRTRVLFRSYVHDATRLDAGAGGALDRVEAEDEAVVTAVQRGVGSRFYHGGRYSPTRERCVHHFHRLLCAFLDV
jgi:choline monooxygenase